jgi:hypothetical protein
MTALVRSILSEIHLDKGGARQHVLYIQHYETDNMTYTTQQSTSTTSERHLELFPLDNKGI